MVPSVRRRLLSRGELPGSDGGLFNPGAVLDGSSLLLVARREVDQRGSPDVHPERIRIDPDTLAVLGHDTLAKASWLGGCRIEDFRCIRFDGMLLAVHTVVRGGRVKPMISRVVGDRLEPFDELELPIATRPLEKNWVLFERNRRLHCLYTLDPLTIFVRTASSRWELIRDQENGWADELPWWLSNSANPIPLVDGHLGFWHARVGPRYVQGAYRLGPDLTITHRTGVLLDGAEVREGFKRGVLYVTGLVEHRDRVLAVYGEGDSHVSVAIFETAALVRELGRNPFQATGTAVRVRYDGTDVGTFARAMWVVRAFCAARPEERVRLYVGDLRLRTIAAFFRVRNLAVRAQDRRTDHDHRLAEDHPEGWCRALGVAEAGPDPAAGATPAPEPWARRDPSHPP